MLPLALGKYNFDTLFLLTLFLSSRYTQYTPYDIVGFILFGLGLLCEGVADQQKFNFR